MVAVYVSGHGSLANGCASSSGMPSSVSSTSSLLSLEARFVERAEAGNNGEHMEPSMDDVDQVRGGIQYQLRKTLAAHFGL